MTQYLPSLALLSLAWLAYFVLHSALASTGVKAWVCTHWPRAGAAYRLIFNAISLVLLLVPLILLGTMDTPQLWRWDGGWAWLANGVGGLAVVGFLLSLRSYDGLDFIGLRQWRERGGNAPVEAFCLSDWHRVVRHPWYFFLLLILWTRDMDLAWLVSALWISLYLIVGSRLEEHKLIQLYGERYRRYRTRVPGLVPLPGRYLTRQQAADLLASKES